MPNYTIVGTGDIAFGTEDVGFTDVGTIQSASKEKTGDELELKDRNGNVFLVVFFNEKGECELTAIWDTGYALPERGDLIDLFDLEDVIIKNVRLDYQNEKEAGITIRATKYGAGMTLGA